MFQFVPPVETFCARLTFSKKRGIVFFGNLPLTTIVRAWLVTFVLVSSVQQAALKSSDSCLFEGAESRSLLLVLVPRTPLWPLAAAVDVDVAAAELTEGVADYLRSMASQNYVVVTFAALGRNSFLLQCTARTEASWSCRSSLEPVVAAVVAVAVAVVVVVVAAAAAVVVPVAVVPPA